MHRMFIAGMAAGAILTGGVGALLGLAAGPAQAQVECSPSNANTAPCAPPEGQPTCNVEGMCGQLWCPGSGMSGIPDWDMTVCHTFYFDPNAPLTEPVIIAGQPPGPVAQPLPCIPLITARSCPV